ncbi:MAG: XRE family transcriptional regulator [Microbacteriaceae bacterium]|nr:MAG: XRE family transcriptional regulator [Microbacteriaceae bacterium]
MASRPSGTLCPNRDFATLNLSTNTTDGGVKVSGRVVSSRVATQRSRRCTPPEDLSLQHSSKFILYIYALGVKTLVIFTLYSSYRTRFTDRVPEPISIAAQTLGKRVREHRQQLGVSQETLAELSGVHWTFIGQVERGMRNLSLHNIVKIADGLGVDPAVLVRGIEARDIPRSDPPKESAASRIRRQRTTSE